MQEAIISDLVNAIRAKQCILFVGAGLSKAIGLPLWEELIAEMKPLLLELAETKKERTEEEKYLNTANYLDIATRFKFKLGLGRYHKFLQEKFRVKNIQLSDAHKALTRMKRWPFIITTNFDKIIETAFTGPNSISPAVVTEPDELILSIRSGDFFILKLHGDIDRFDSIVLTRDEYEQFIYQRRGQLLLDTLKQQLIFRNVLFIGFGLNDPNFLRVFGEAGWLANGYQGEAFSIMANTTKPEREEWQRRHLRIISLKNHNELSSMLNEIADQVIGLGKDVVVINKLGADFVSPKQFLTTNPFIQICRKWQMDFVSEQIITGHSGMSANYLESDEIWKTHNVSYKELGMTNHLLVTLAGKEIDMVPENFWDRMPCDYDTLYQHVMKEHKTVFGISENDGLYILLVVTFSNEEIKKAILDFLNLTTIPV